MFFKIEVLKHFTIFTGKDLCWSLFLIKFQAFRRGSLLKKDSSHFIKRRLQHRCFSVKIAKFLRTAFFIEHLLSLLLIVLRSTHSIIFSVLLLWSYLCSLIHLMPVSFFNPWKHQKILGCIVKTIVAWNVLTLYLFL